MNEEAILAIKSFVISLGLGSSKMSLSDLADGDILVDMLCMIDGFPLEKQKIVKETDNWTVGLNNIKIITKALSDYYKQYLRKSLPSVDWQLIEICKNHNFEHIVRLFGVVLGALTQSSNKEVFIERILSLPTEHQAYFAEVIRNTMSNSEDLNDSHQERKLLEQMEALETENFQLRGEISKNIQRENKIIHQIKDLEAKLQASRLEIEYLKFNRLETSSIIEPEVQQIALQEKILVEKLKQKLINLSMEHEKEIMKYKEEIMIIESKIFRIPELEAMVDMYKENYEEALEHLSKIKVWQKEKQKMTLQIEQYVQLISEKTETMSDLNEKVYKLEQELLQSQIQYEKLTVRYNELENQVKKTLNLEQKGVRMGRHTLTELCPQISEESNKFKLDEALRQLERKNKRVKELERDVSKYKAKADRVYQLEKEKTKLENIIVDFNQSKSQQIEILITSLYELRLKYGMIVEQFSTHNGHLKQRHLSHPKTQS